MAQRERTCSTDGCPRSTTRLKVCLVFFFFFFFFDQTLSPLRRDKPERDTSLRVLVRCFTYCDGPFHPHPTSALKVATRSADEPDWSTLRGPKIGNGGRCNHAVTENDADFEKLDADLFEVDLEPLEETVM